MDMSKNKIEAVFTLSLWPLSWSNLMMLIIVSFDAFDKA